MRLITKALLGTVCVAGACAASIFTYSKIHDSSDSIKEFVEKSPSIKPLDTSSSDGEWEKNVKNYKNVSFKKFRFPEHKSDDSVDSVDESWLKSKCEKLGFHTSNDHRKLVRYVKWCTVGEKLEFKDKSKKD